MRRVLLSWSSGKDSAWALHRLRADPDLEVVGLLTTFDETTDRVAMHRVRHELVVAQARAASLPLWPVPLPSPCPNDEYERRMTAVVHRARQEGVTQIAFGDLFLEDIRAYREQRLAGTGVTPVFPLWTTPDDTPALARTMVTAGLEAVLTCVDVRQLASDVAGRRFDPALLDALPATVDPCGERGEFHTFCVAGPMFDAPITVRIGDAVERDGFRHVDLLPS